MEKEHGYRENLSYDVNLLGRSNNCTFPHPSMRYVKIASYYIRGKNNLSIFTKNAY